MNDYHIRWMIRRDLFDVLTIERQSYPNPWQEEDFIRCLRQRNCIGMVAEFEEKVVGFMLYELHKTRLHVLNFAVNPEFRLRGVGREMIVRLVKKVSGPSRRLIKLEVREGNLDAQLFFSRMGFRAVAVLKGFYNDSDEDAYRMLYRYRSAPMSNSGELLLTQLDETL